VSALSAAGEEIGWRGFLVPELAKKYSYTKTSLITALIWNLYHYPLLLFSDYNNGVSVASSLVFFTVSVTGVCFITSWLRLKSGSLWGAVLLHAAHNFYIQGVFDVLTIDGAATRLFTTEFGIGLAVFYALVAFFFWRRRRSLPDPAPKPIGIPGNE
jgi:membrane protease YdiL (CAAX protease family)